MPPPKEPDYPYLGCDDELVSNATLFSPFANKLF
jgi:hypothetical protein